LLLLLSSLLVLQLLLALSRSLSPSRDNILDHLADNTIAQTTIK